jgi:hexosaminidase
MMYSKYIVAVLLLTISISFAVRTDEAPVLPVVPHPQEVVYGTGSLPYEGGTVSIHLYGSDHHASAGLGIAELEETFMSVSGIRPERGLSGDLVIHIGIPSGDRGFRRLSTGYGIEAGERIGKEGYVLHIDSTGVVLAARESSGLYYGMQTLKQLLRGSIGSGALPSVRITDWPDMGYRGVMDDISRGPVPTLEFMKLQVRRIAELKLNMLMYYTEHVVETERHGEFAPAGGGVSIAQWRELSDYARRYHVTLVGNFQSFGHFRNILSHPRYAPLGERGSLLSPVLPESEQLLRDIYEEMVPAFDSPYFCVNSDETFDLGKGASKDRVDSLGLGVVYAEHILRMHGILKELGVRMMMWGDIVLQHPEVLDMLPKDIIMMAWDYSPRDSYTHLFQPFIEHGFDFTVSPGVLNSYRIMPDYGEAVENIRTFIADGVRHGAYGSLLTVWDDGGSALFSRDWYGVAYSAENAWSETGNELASFDTRFNAGIYGDHQTHFTKGLWKLVSLADLTVTERMNEQPLWINIFPERGQELRIDISEWDRVLAIAEKADSILHNAHPSFYVKDLEYFSFTADLYRYMAQSRMTLLGASERYRSAALAQRDDPPFTRKELVSIIDDLTAVRRTLREIYNTYRRLWFLENRIYAIDRVLDPIEEMIGNFDDITNRVLSALSDYDKGHYLPPPREVRLDIGVVGGTYFREWMFVTPLPNDGMDVDYLEAMGGEREVRPGVTEEFTYGGSIYRWHRNISPYLDVVDLSELYPLSDRDAILYCYATLESPTARTVRATVGIRGSIELIVNGRSVYTKYDSDHFVLDDETVEIPLKAGRNHIMVKTGREGGAGWRFSFRLPDQTVHMNKNRYRIVE